LIPENPKKKKNYRKFIHLKSSIKLLNKKETNKSIIYTHSETMASLLVHVASISHIYCLPGRVVLLDECFFIGELFPP
jgi:hypothetical protein